MSAPVQVPADVEREDRLLGPLTARQVVILGCAAAAVYGLWRLFGPDRLVWFVAASVPVALIGTALTVGRRDGLALDRLLLAALRQRAALRMTPRAQLEPDRAAGARRAGSGRVVSSRAPLLGVRAAGSDRLGIADLGGSGSVVVCAVAPLNLSLRSAGEQDAAVAGFARWLHSLSAPVQLLTRTRPLDLHGPISRLHTAAHRLGNPALARAALGHAAHLHALDRGAELLDREFLIVFRDPGPTGRGPRESAAAAEGLRRRAGEAAALLGPIGLRVIPLTDADAAAVLRRASNPATVLQPDPGPGVEPGVRDDVDPGPGNSLSRGDAGQAGPYADPPTIPVLARPGTPWASTGPPDPPGPRWDGERWDDVDHDPTALGGQR